VNPPEEITISEEEPSIRLVSKRLTVPSIFKSELLRSTLEFSRWVNEADPPIIEKVDAITLQVV